ncbi:flagellar biosynthetic protein FliQ [Pseudacidovorax sp. 1753]|uniref:flagellar biosynthetic protein FliQ n=1 Tax=Pseudacidovorax sp. 1753 TaxID=3156419 RepID=UPI003399A172
MSIPQTVDLSGKHCHKTVKLRFEDALRSEVVLQTTQVVSVGAGMHADLALKMMSDLFWTGLLLCFPLLGTVMVVGLVISVLQVVTQIQEMSLTFVPKLLAAGAAIVVTGPWMLRKLTQFTVQLWTSIPMMF